MDKYRTSNENIVCYLEGELSLGELNIHTHILTEDEDLRPLLLGMLDDGREVPLITSKDGVINSLYMCEWDDDEGKYITTWCVKSCPNMRICRPIIEKLGFVYVGQDITAIGGLIFNNVLGGNTEGLKSTTLGSIFTPERAFNASTNTAQDEEDKSQYGSCDRDYYRNERFDRTISIIANKIPVVMAKKASDEMRWKRAQMNMLKYREQAGDETAPDYFPPQPTILTLNPPPQEPACPAFLEGEIDPLKQEAIDLGLIDEFSIPIEGREEEYMEWLMEETDCSYTDETNEHLADIEFSNDNEDDLMDMVDLSHIGEYASIDIRKCYTSCLENPSNPFMRFEVFDNVVPMTNREFDNALGWYYVDFIDPDHEFFPFVNMRNGWFCLKVIQLARARKGLDFNIQAFLAPHKRNILGKINKKDDWGNWYTSPDNYFTEFVNYVYDNLADCCVCDKGCAGGCAPKFVVNSFIGRLGMYHREKTYSSSYVVRHDY